MYLQATGWNRTHSRRADTYVVHWCAYVYIIIVCPQALVINTPGTCIRDCLLDMLFSARHTTNTEQSKVPMTSSRHTLLFLHQLSGEANFQPLACEGGLVLVYSRKHKAFFTAQRLHSAFQMKQPLHILLRSQNTRSSEALVAGAGHWYSQLQAHVILPQNGPTCVIWMFLKVEDPFHYFGGTTQETNQLDGSLF